MSWPSYPVGPTDHVHALGVVSINYNTLESNLLVATIFYLDGKAAPAAIIFDTTRNNTRIDLLRALWAHEPLAEVRERLNHFADGFLKCAQNRNILMHSYLTSRVHESDILRLAKRSKQQSSVSTYEFGLNEIRRVADEIRAFATFGSNIIGYRLRLQNPRAPWPATLPKEPPLPAVLAKQDTPARQSE